MSRSLTRRLQNLEVRSSALRVAFVLIRKVNGMWTTLIDLWDGGKKTKRLLMQHETLMDAESQVSVIIGKYGELRGNAPIISLHRKKGG